MSRLTVAEIDLDAIAFNVRQTRKLVGPNVRICAAVKADAYGHGAIPISRTILDGGIEMLGVAMLEEALELREAGIRAPILLLQCVLAGDIPEIVRNDISAMVCSRSFALQLSDEAAKAGAAGASIPDRRDKRTKVHLKVDTGMGRVGVQADETVDLARELSGMPGIEIEGIFTHFASADEEEQAFTRKQIADFRDVIREVKAAGVHIPFRHAANSAGMLNVPESHFNMVRPGIMLYGLYDSGYVSRTPELRQALTLKTGIVFLKELPAGSAVSYGRTYTASRKSLVATMPIGYADGYNRRLSNQAHALVRGFRVPIIGRVCMDQTMLDVTDVPGVSVGDEVVLYGKQGDQEITMEEIESHVGTISYEIVCAISKRVPRVYVRKG